MTRSTAHAFHYAELLPLLRLLLVLLALALALLPSRAGGMAVGATASPIQVASAGGVGSVIASVAGAPAEPPGVPPMEPGPPPDCA